MLCSHEWNSLSEVQNIISLRCVRTLSSFEGQLLGIYGIMVPGLLWLVAVSDSSDAQRWPSELHWQCNQVHVEAYSCWRCTIFVSKASSAGMWGATYSRCLRYTVNFILSVLSCEANNF
jgi:hypothetical protein